MMIIPSYDQDYLIKLTGTFNTRDLGGYLTESGKMIKKRRLIRSDDLFKLTSKDISILSNVYHLNTIIDFRNSNERRKRPDKIIPGAKYYVLTPDDETAVIASSSLNDDRKKIDRLLKLNREGKLKIDKNGLKNGMINFVKEKRSQKLYRKMLDLCIARNDAVVLEHCRGGKDRTGYGTALILLALGVDQEIVVQDYLMTAHYNKERNERRMNEYRQYTQDQAILDYLASAMETREDVIRAGLNEMKRLAGTPVNYIEQVLGFDSEKIAYMRQMYLE
ncbi:MAG: tyrosine-protein phosphatase [Lactobacillus crispatus]|uniref:tyrosine-protein phosphatase n=1 Tax=Lactobacillus crispatus TaxID=47770 RepID=UPI002549C2FE|nr:tyrosine-protein phosphatase [Lactobacillus crispatus]MDK6376327.1 tyrosine-protein phosphatase [Lactobacillus crispatus]MDK8507980.1 tyrosine-protein phosphatase [Lactobacillus crispatus]